MRISVFLYAQELAAHVHRNIAVHDYQNVNLTILQKIIEYHLDDLHRYIELILKVE